ncbi:MAG: hypothetical protein JWN48_2644 [Myxococcaceae bacterium]|nr:hypothetical protein [Myxococcaceae bacterium]
MRNLELAARRANLCSCVLLTASGVLLGCGGGAGEDTPLAQRDATTGQQAVSGSDAGPLGEPGADGGPSHVAQPADSPKVYVAKVKNLLVGAAPTDDEIRAVQKDPAQLGALIDGWMKLPMYRDKLQTFFELSFQQTQISISDLADQSYPRQADINGATQPLLLNNVRESFARTVLQLLDEGRPFTEVVTTRRLMMTPALMELYAFYDAWQVDNAGKVSDRFRLANPKLNFTVSSASGPIPIADTLSVAGPNYMHWYDPDLPLLEARQPGCGPDPMQLAAKSDNLHFMLYGGLTGYDGTPGLKCTQYGGSAAAGQLSADDFDTWKMVTIRQPEDGEASTSFFDLPKLRSSDTLVTTTPRVGFFSTPAFFANWQTNVSNQMRVTMNQALIVALGAAVDGTDSTEPGSTPGLEADHSNPPECLFCHKTLDPTRSIMAATYSWNYHDQTAPAYAAQKGIFAFRGVVQPVSDVYQLADVLANHPRFAPAWVQKLCYYANSAPCAEDDPEFQRLVALFKSGGYSFTSLLRELFRSPLVTGAMPTVSRDDNAAVVAVSRRDHLCAALNTRLGFRDVCGLDAQARAPAKSGIQAIVPGLPSDGYGRGAVAPVLPNQPSLFFRAGLENICTALADMVIDVPAKKQVAGSRQWTSDESDVAISDFVALLMAFTPSDSRSAPAQTLLRGHFTAAQGAGASASDALKSTFIVACLSPSTLAIGM